MIRRLLPLLLIASCGDPPPMVLKFAITSGDVQSCTSSTGTKATSCDQVTMLCDAYASVRIFAPSDPSAPFVSACQPLAVGATANHKNLCSIAQVSLPAPTAPVSAQTLEVDITVYAKDSLHTDRDGNIVCPSQPAFGADGFPVAAFQPCPDPQSPDCQPPPAVGGRAFYHPGDTETVVSLGCTNLEALQDRSCSNQSTLSVSATVNDFDSAVSVSPTTADGLLVSVGEPTFFGSLNEYQLQSSQLHVLDRQPQGPVPSWQGNFDNLQLNNSACLDVFEDGAEAAVLTCTNNIARNPLDLPGIRLATASLDQIRTALGLSTVPEQGLVVGVALSYLGIPQSGVTIVPSDPNAHILYLSKDRSGVVPGGTATTDSGVWVSEDAKYGTTFTTGDITVLTQPGFGGLVHQKVDVVVIQLKQPGTGG